MITAMLMKIQVFWDTVSFWLANSHWHFWGTCSPHLHGPGCLFSFSLISWTLTMEVASCSDKALTMSLHQSV